MRIITPYNILLPNRSINIYVHHFDTNTSSFCIVHGGANDRLSKCLCVSESYCCTYGDSIRSAHEYLFAEPPPLHFSRSILCTQSQTLAPSFIITISFAVHISFGHTNVDAIGLAYGCSLREPILVWRSLLDTHFSTIQYTLSLHDAISERSTVISSLRLSFAQWRALSISNFWRQVISRYGAGSQS